MSKTRTSLMIEEAHEAPQVIERQLRGGRVAFQQIANRLRRMKPRFIATCARGSSDHAATYAKYLIETQLGVPVLRFAPSIGTLYNAPLNLENTVLLCISQSGASFDLVDSATWARRQGAWVISLLNTPESPLGQASDTIVSLGAGKERSVAATKSLLASLSAVLQLVAYARADRALLRLLDALPSQLDRASELDWSNAEQALVSNAHLFTVGRGLGLCAAQEAALKLKETCGIHAEAFSGAELLHGPVTLLAANWPVLLFGQSDETASLTQELANQLRTKGISVFAAGLGPDAAVSSAFSLPVVPDVHPALAPLLLLQTFYGFAAKIAVLRGMDPDNPPHLQKVQKTH